MELVVSADLLQLDVGIHQRLPVPQPYIVDGGFVRLKCFEGKVLFGGKRLYRDLTEIVGLLGERYIPLDVGLLQLQLARLHKHALEYCGNKAGQYEGTAEDKDYRNRGKPVCAGPNIRPRDECRDNR